MLGRKRFTSLAQGINREDVDLVGLGNKCIDHCMRVLDNIVNSQTPESLRSVVDELDQVSNNLCSIIDYSEAVCRLYKNPKAYHNARSTVHVISALMTRLNADASIYNTLKKSLRLDEEERFLCDEGRSVGNSLLCDFEKSGIGLSGKDRKEFAQLQMQIQTAGYKFEESLDNSPQKSLVKLFDLLKYRAKAANILGYPSYSKLFLQDKMLKNPQQVNDFLSRIRADKDLSFLSSQSSVNSGLDLRMVLEIIQVLCQKFFYLKFVAEKEKLWDLNSLHLKFTHSINGTYMGDLFFITKRSEERNLVACHYPIRTWRARPTENIVYSQSGTSQTPICIVTAGVRDKANLTFTEIQSIFHEFGHAFHTLTANTLYHHLSGTRCKLDFAEVPSTLMEIVLANSENLSLRPEFASDHFKWTSQNHEKSSVNLDQQIKLAKCDQFVHSLGVADLGDFNQFSDLLKDWCRGNTTNPIECSSLLGQVSQFRHLVTYGAGYYSYLFSSWIAKGVWRKYFDPKSSQYEPKVFLRNALCHGGTLSTDQLVKNLDLKID